jgi:hypothetical protein
MLAAAALALPAGAQYVGRVDTQPANASHLRATAVLEFTGDLSKINASRLVPVAIWDGVQYQPAGLYLAQPAPLAVLSGTQYELESDGQAQGFFDIKDAEDLAGLWIGVGSFEAPPPPPARKSAANSNHTYVVKDVDPDKPHFAHRPAPDDSQSDGSARADGPTDPNHPTLHSRTGSTDASTESSNPPAANQPDVDSGRPTFHHRATQTSTNSTAVDPDRPHLTYTDPAEQEKLAKPDALFGIPADMKQIAGISDSNPIDTQSFAFSWANPDDAAKMQGDLEAVAEQALAPPAPAPAPASKTTHSTHRKAAPPPEPPALQDVQFHVFSLTFGGGATMVLSAHSASTPAKYITIVAQPDFYGKAQVLLKQVTSDDALDVTPRLNLIDAVDTQGNNRGDLVFELRGQTYRQFAIYRISGGTAARVFVTQATAL